MSSVVPNSSCIKPSILVQSFYVFSLKQHLIFYTLNELQNYTFPFCLNVEAI